MIQYVVVMETLIQMDVGWGLLNVVETQIYTWSTKGNAENLLLSEDYCLLSTAIFSFSPVKMK